MPLLHFSLQFIFKIGVFWRVVLYFRIGVAEQLEIDVQAGVGNLKRISSLPMKRYGWNIFLEWDQILQSRHEVQFCKNQAKLINKASFLVAVLKQSLETCLFCIWIVSMLDGREQNGKILFLLRYIHHTNSYILTLILWGLGGEQTSQELEPQCSD